MISQTLSLVSALFGAIGPGLVLVVALPFLLAALVVFTRVTLRRTKRRA